MQAPTMVKLYTAQQGCTNYGDYTSTKSIIAADPSESSSKVKGLRHS